MKAERDKRAAVLQAEGEKAAAILKADGEKQAAILRGRRAARRRRSAMPRRASGWRRPRRRRPRCSRKALTEGNMQAANYFVAQKYLEALTAFAASPNQKTLILPIEATAALGSLAGIAELAREAMGGRAPRRGDAGRDRGTGRRHDPRPSGTGWRWAACSCCWRCSRRASCSSGWRWPRRLTGSPALAGTELGWQLQVLFSRPRPLPAWALWFRWRRRRRPAGREARA